ncbi:MAG: hypothetical protein ACREJT_12295, partial [Myxococcota bacterium]
MSARLATVAALALTAFGLVACAKPQDPIVDCTPSGDARPICGFQNPEDLAQLPASGALVISQMGRMDGSKSGSMVFFELATDAITPAFGGASAANLPARPGWGDPACPGSPGEKFSPHGLSLARRPDGALQLLVVNHGGRESIELFEVTDSNPPALTWRGCALPPEGAFLNDVAALPDGGFVTTHMFPKGSSLWPVVKGMLGLSTGFVYEWQPDTGFRKIPGSDGGMPNGITASPDGEALYVDLYFANEVRKISRRTGETLATVEIASPDNVLWSPDGSLLVASHNAPINEVMACGELEHGTCPFHFSIVLLDPETLAPRALYE